MKYLTTFTKQKPPYFEGNPIGIVAEDWLLHIEKILDALAISDNGQMVRLATFMFKSDAENWWRMVKKSCDVTRMNKKQFIKLFFDRHFPRAERDKLASEFNNLEQVSTKLKIQ